MENFEIITPDQLLDVKGGGWTCEIQGECRRDTCNCAAEQEFLDLFFGL